MATNYDYITACPDGLIICEYSTDKLAFHGHTPTSMSTDSGQAAITITAGATSGSALVASLQSLATANKALVNQIAGYLTAKGLWHGS